MSDAFRFNKMNDEAVMEERILPTQKQSRKTALLQAVAVGLLLLLLVVVAILGGIIIKRQGKAVLF